MSASGTPAAGHRQLSCAHKELQPPTAQAAVQGAESGHHQHGVKDRRFVPSFSLSSILKNVSLCTLTWQAAEAVAAVKVTWALRWGLWSSLLPCISFSTRLMTRCASAGAEFVLLHDCQKRVRTASGLSTVLWQLQIIFDVGHQAYGHKILTGRRERMHTIRQTGGLSGVIFIQASPSAHKLAGSSCSVIQSDSTIVIEIFCAYRLHE